MTDETRFFTYGQNNSGGVFDLTDDVTHWVIIEAYNALAANSKLASIGGYFDGCEAGIDCPCCGDRWDAQWGEDAGEPEPMVYGETPSEWVTKDSFLCMEKGKEVVVHYADGRKEWF